MSASIGWGSYMLRWIRGIVAVAALGAGPSVAEELWLTPEIPEVRFALKGQDVVIARAQGEVPMSCPPDCLQPIRADETVATFGALEVVGFLANDVAANRGHLVDVRLPAEFAAQRLPGAVNVPLATLAPDNPFLKDILLALGATEVGGALDFGAAHKLVVYGEGPASEAAAQAARHLVAAGYPPEKVIYFRGGLQEWRDFALTEIRSGDQG